MAKNRKLFKSWGRTRLLPGTSRQAFEAIERADSAMKKLFLDEPLDDNELDALLHSEYLNASQEGSHSGGSQTLYVASQFELAAKSPFLFQSIEAEIIAYFARHPELMFSLPPRKFEELIAAVFRQDGFDVELTPESRDGGIDIFAVKKDALAGQSLYLIECKRYQPENTVGIGIVQRLLGVVEQHKATKGIVMTTSTFTRDAKVVAQSASHRLALNEYREISKWLAQFTGQVR